MDDIFDQIHREAQGQPAPDQPAPDQPAPQGDQQPPAGDIFEQVHREQQGQPQPPKVPPAKPNVARGVSDEDLIKSFGYDPSLIQKSPFYQQMKKWTGSGFNWMISPQSAAQEHGLPDDVIQGLGNVVMGIAQGGQHVQGALGLHPEDTPYTDLLTKVYGENYRQNILGGREPTFWEKRGQDIGGALPTLFLGPGEAAPSLLRGMGQGALTGAAIGATQPVYTNPNDPNSYLTQKTWQTALGATVGAGAPVVVRGLTGAAARLISMFRTPLPEEAANELAARLQQRLAGNWGNLNDLQQMASGADPALAGRARTTLDLINNAGTDPTKIEQAALKLEDFRSALHSKSLYSTVGQMADKLGEVPLNRTTQTLDSIIDDLEAEKAPNAELINYFKGIRSKLTPQPAGPVTPPPTNIQDYMKWKAQQAQTLPPGNTYGRMRELSDDLGDMVRFGSKGRNAMISTRAARQMQMLQSAVNGDLTDFTQNSGVPALQAAATAADQYYRDYRTPFLDRAVAKAGSTDEADTILGMAAQGGMHADRAEKFFNVLGPKGRAAVQSQMLDKIINDASDHNGNLNPGLFLDGLKRYQQAYAVFFRGADQAAIEGLRNLMLHAANIQKMPLGAGGAGLGVSAAALHFLGVPHAIEAGAGLALAGQTAKELLQTNLGKRVLYNALATKPLTPEMGQLFGVARSFAPVPSRLAAAAATMPSGPIIVKPWQPPPGFAAGGLNDRIRRNTFRSLGYDPD